MFSIVDIQHMDIIAVFLSSICLPEWSLAKISRKQIFLINQL